MSCNLPQNRVCFFLPINYSKVVAEVLPHFILQFVIHAYVQFLVCEYLVFLLLQTTYQMTMFVVKYATSLCVQRTNILFWKLYRCSIGVKRLFWKTCVALKTWCCYTVALVFEMIIPGLAITNVYKNGTASYRKQIARQYFSTSNIMSIRSDQKTFLAPMRPYSWSRGVVDPRKKITTFWPPYKIWLMWRM